MCGVVFRCGCTWPWAGGWKYCNVHNPDPNSPRCPWCIAGSATSWSVSDRFVISLMMLAYALAVYCNMRYACESWKRHLRFIAPPAMFLLQSLVAGIAFVCATGYPYFLFFTFP